MGGLINGKLGGDAITNLDDGTPLGKAGTLVVKGFGAGGEAIETLGSILVLCSSKDNKALIKLNSSVNSTSGEKLDKVLTIRSGLVDGLLEHDDTRDTLLNTRGGKEKLAVSSSVGLVVFDGDGLEATADRGS